MRTADWTDSVSVLDRVTAVFEAFGEHDEGLGVSELARRANLPKSTVSRIVADLVGQRFLERDGDKLYLGIRLFELGQTVQRPRELRTLALPVMTDLRNLTGHTVHLAVLEGGDIVFLAIVRGWPTPKPLGRVGGRLPAHATALGKAILATSARDVVESIVNEERVVRVFGQTRQSLFWRERAGLLTVARPARASIAAERLPLEELFAIHLHAKLGLA